MTTLRNSQDSAENNALNGLLAVSFDSVSTPLAERIENEKIVKELYIEEIVNKTEQKK
jgi:hypothetical protein